MRLGQRPAQQGGLLVVVEAADEIGGVFAMRLAGIEPQAGAGDAIHQRLHHLRTLVDQILPHDENAGHVVGPVFAGLEEDAAKAAQFRLRGKRLTHRESIDGAGRQGAGDIGRRHLDHLDFARLDAPHLHGAEDQQALVGKAAGNGDGAAAHIGEGLDGAVFAHHDRAAVAVAQVDDLDGNALGFESDGQRRDDEGGLHAVRDQRFLDLGKALEHARQKDFAATESISKCSR